MMKNEIKKGRLVMSESQHLFQLIYKYSQSKKKFNIMRAKNVFALVILSATILSYGLSGAVYAQTNIPPLSVETSLPAYNSGLTVAVSGHVKDLADYDQDVTILIIDSNNNIVSISQATPNANGDYSKDFVTGGTWKTSGEYTIKVQVWCTKS